MNRNLMPLVAEIVSAHVSRNDVSPQGISEAIKSVYATLNAVTAGSASEATGGSTAPSPGQHPAVPIGKSVFPDYIICLEDGKRMKMLKRHLKTSYDLTPEEYRERWGLPGNYPMVAPNYVERRSELARENGLGRKPGSTVSVTRVKEGVSGKKIKRNKAA
jgi:predicted transcriptional regulator